MSSKELKKIKMDIKNLKKFSNILILEQEVLVRTVIDFETQEKMVLNFVSRLFGDHPNAISDFTGTNRFLAEGGLRGDVIFFLTNLDLDHLVAGAEDFIFDDVIFEKMTDEIKNWHSFRCMLDAIVGDIQQERIAGQSLNEILNKVDKVLQNLSPETFEKISESVKEFEKTVKDSNISGLIEEAQKVEK